MPRESVWAHQVVSSWRPLFEMPQFPQSLAQSRYAVTIRFCFNTHGANLGLWPEGMTREPKRKAAAGRGKEGQTVLYKLLLCSSGCNLSQRTIWSDSATVWSPPLNVGNCINQHISPKAESIYSTARLLAIIRPPAMIAFAPCVLSPASQGKGRGVISGMMFVCNPNIWEVEGKCKNGGSGLDLILFSSCPQLCPAPRVSLRAYGRCTLHFPFLSTSFTRLQILFSWPFEKRGAHTEDSPSLGERAQRRMVQVPETGSEPLRQGSWGGQHLLGRGGATGGHILLDLQMAHPVGRSTGHPEAREGPFTVGAKAGSPGRRSKGDSLRVGANREAWGSRNLTLSHCQQDWASQSCRSHLSGARPVWSSGNGSHHPSCLHSRQLNGRLSHLLLFDSHRRPVGSLGKGVSPAMSRWGSWGSEKWCDLPEVTHLQWRKAWAPVVDCLCRAPAATSITEVWNRSCMVSVHPPYL